jgi:hypothetical protein
MHECMTHSSNEAFTVPMHSRLTHSTIIHTLALDQ